MKPFRHSIVLGILTSALMNSQTPNSPAPPVAPQVDHREVRHGATVVDPYFWLREKTNPKVVQYLEAENAYTEAVTKEIKPFSDALYQEMLGRIKQTDLSVPARRGPYLYYSRTEEGKQYPIQCRRKGSMEAPEEVLLDLNELGKDKKFVSLGAFAVSDDQNLLAYTIDYVGFRQYALQVKDLRTGATLPDTTERVTTVAWAADNKTLFLTTEDEVTKRSDKLFRHVLGASAFELLYEDKDELYDITLGKTRDHQYLVVLSESKDTSENLYLRASEPEGKFAVFLPRENKHRYYLDHREGLFYIRTNKTGKDFAVMTASVKDRRDRSLQGIRRLRGEDAGPQPPARVQLQERRLDHRGLPRAGLLRVPRRHAGFRFHHLPLQLSEPDHAAQRLRFRYPHREIDAAQAAGGARRVRSQTVCE
jgi:oligopeptidase B